MATRKTRSKMLDVQDLTAECLIAFGQGTHHSLCVAHDAIAVLRKHFEPRLRRHLRNWDGISDSTLGHARHLGGIAGYLAAKQGSMVIKKKHCTDAIRLKGQGNTKVCPICPV